MRTALFVLLLVRFQVSAATYYIDMEGGSDANNGTSTATPFKRCPGDTAATGTAASTTPAAGDTLKFKGGVIYTNQINVNWSGTVGGGYIKYDGNWSGGALNEWGNGRAIVDRHNILNAQWLVAGSPRFYIIVDGFEIRNLGGDADDATNVISAAAGTYTNTVNTGGVGINFFTQGGHSNIYIGNLWGHRIGGWRNSIGWTENTIQGGLVFIKDSLNWTVTNIHAIKMKNAIGLATSTGMMSNGIVTSCSISNYITWGLDVACQQDGGVWAKIDLCYNKIHDYQQYAQENWLGVGDWPHTDGMFLRSTGKDTTETNINIYKNEFYCDVYTALGGTASIYLSQGFSANIYSNLFNNDSQTRLVGVDHLIFPPNKKVWVYITNNTFIGAPPAVSVCCETNLTSKTVVVKNNIMVKRAGGTALYVHVNNIDGAAYITTLDGNLYWAPDFNVSTMNVYAGLGTDYTLFGDMFSKFGYEANGAYSNPLFTTESATPSLYDTMPQAGSPAIAMKAGWKPYVQTIFPNTPRAYKKIKGIRLTP